MSITSGSHKHNIIFLLNTYTLSLNIHCCFNCLVKKNELFVHFKVLIKEIIISIIKVFREKMMHTYC